MCKPPNRCSYAPSWIKSVLFHFCVTEETGGVHVRKKMNFAAKIRLELFFHSRHFKFTWSTYYQTGHESRNTKLLPFKSLTDIMASSRVGSASHFHSLWKMPRITLSPHAIWKYFSTLHAKARSLPCCPFPLHSGIHLAFGRKLFDWKGWKFFWSCISEFLVATLKKKSWAHSSFPPVATVTPRGSIFTLYMGEWLPWHQPLLIPVCFKGPYILPQGWSNFWGTTPGKLSDWVVISSQCHTVLFS